ncbi:VOC family protein [Vibrio ulleungensis]|uniref:VOC family protein n=2 Tax=Vibrio TaxID=662 RepID=A0ABS2HFJ6_9VIBR|nr:VOC family protein [Vibrio ulleungensis]MBM7034847.1 VOC family protein [Vibrio ulleungensis]
MSISINITSVAVKDQQVAHDFYTQKLGFVVKHDIPMGEYRWLTLVAPNHLEGTELLLEPMAFEPAKVYQAALKDAGIPCTSFEVDNMDAEVARLTELGVSFQGDVQNTGDALIATLDDGCGNWIMLTQTL